jgi:hypothetical protein
MALPREQSHESFIYFLSNCTAFPRVTSTQPPSSYNFHSIYRHFRAILLNPILAAPSTHHSLTQNCCHARAAHSVVRHCQGSTSTCNCGTNFDATTTATNANQHVRDRLT